MQHVLKLLCCYLMSPYCLWERKIFCNCTDGEFKKIEMYKACTLPQEFASVFTQLWSSSQAEKKGASNSVVGLIFGCFALVNFLSSLVLGNYVSMIEAVTYFCDDMGWYMKTVLWGWEKQCLSSVALLQACVCSNWNLAIQLKSGLCLVSTT